MPKTFCPHISRRCKIKSINTKCLVQTAVVTSLIGICAQIIVPLPYIPITMQIFAVFFALEYLGGKRGAVCILVYILAGIAGLPVFASFKSGISSIFGATGGYILGFLPTALVYAALSNFLKPTSVRARVFICISSLLVCYCFGTLWFVFVYANQGKAATFLSVVLTCVAPYVVWDILKIYLAVKTADLIKKVGL